MLAPRFTLRTGLLWLTGGSLIAVVLRAAIREESWAIGVAVGLASIVFILAIHAAAFLAALALSRGQNGEGE